jgi:hypothetical protein
LTIQWQGPALVFLLVAVLLAIGFGPMIYREYKSNRTLEHGLDASARVLAIRETGNLHNNQPEVRIQLEVEPADRNAFKASVTTFMSPVYIPRFQPGATVAVRYDPASIQSVVLVPDESH